MTIIRRQIESTSSWSRQIQCYEPREKRNRYRKRYRTRTVRTAGGWRKRDDFTRGYPFPKVIFLSPRETFAADIFLSSKLPHLRISDVDDFDRQICIIFTQIIFCFNIFKLRLCYNVSCYLYWQCFSLVMITFFFELIDFILHSIVVSISSKYLIF